MYTIIAECAGIIICFFAGYKKSKGLFSFSRRTLLYTLLFSCLYVVFILAISSTTAGEDTFREFVFGVSLEPFILLLFYPLVIAVSEEYIFRYFLESKIGTAFGTMIFTVAHWRPDFPPLMFLFVFVFGLVQVYLFKKSGGLWAPIIGHLAVTYTLLRLFV